MHRFLYFLLITYAFYAYYGCCNNISGGYDYPSTIATKDSSFPFLPLKDILGSKDSFRFAQNNALFEVFHEPNLSIHPLRQPVYRFIYEGWQEETVIINCYEHELVVKTGASNYFRQFDPPEKNLTEAEQWKYHFFQKNFPVKNSSNYPKKRRKYLDSMTRVYPELLNAGYYMQLSKKVNIINDSFSYNIRHIPLAPGQFRSLERELMHQDIGRFHGISNAGMGLPMVRGLFWKPVPRRSGIWYVFLFAQAGTVS